MLTRSKYSSHIIGVDEVGRLRNGRASRQKRDSPSAEPHFYNRHLIGIDEVGRAARKKRASLAPQSFLIGLDEVGRGPLAGPVVVAGVRLKLRSKNQEARIFYGIKDSKKLTPKQREEWYEFLTNHSEIQWATAVVSPSVIDCINISQAANLGALRVYRKLSANSEFLTSKQISELRNHNDSFIRKFARNSLFVDKVLMDGGLKLPYQIPHKAIIKGDEKIPAISAASIIAKVTRDRIMECLHKKYPKYKFDVHKGYGTKLHRDMIKKFGRSEIHRKSFQCDR